MIALDGRSLVPRDVASVARHGEQVELAPAARARNDAARATLAELVAGGTKLYGVSTGVGALRGRAIPAAERERFQWNLLRSHAASAGRPLAAELVRAGMVVRANQLGAGGAGVTGELLDALIASLNADVVPFTRELGSLGTGDLAGLAEIALALLGEGRMWREGKLIAAPAPARPVRLGLRDALGFISSNALTIGHAALICVDSEQLQQAWLTVAALSFEAIAADPVVFDERVQVAHGASGQTAVAARMRELLRGAAPAGDATSDRHVQDPYPFRVLPQVDGVATEALETLERIVTGELGARAENALIDGGEALPNGNFHAARLAAALDVLRAAYAQSASLIAARVSTLLDPRLSGLTPFLAERPGVDAGMMMLEYTAHAAAAEVRLLATPMATQAVSASLGVESHASLAATAARRSAEALEAMRTLVATELAVAMRALRLAGRTARGAGSAELFARAVQMLPPGLEDRAFGHDVELAATLLAEWVENIRS